MSKTLKTKGQTANIQRVGHLSKPVESANTQRVGEFDHEDRVIQYHFAAERCGNLSVWCAAMAGAELIRKKKDLPRGQFEPYKAALPFGRSTCDNYMNLAKKLEEKLLQLPEDRRMALLPELANAQKATECALALLNLPSPMDVFNPQHERIADIIREVTSEQTLRQLYFDWDIVKAPKALAQRGGIRRALTDIEKHEAAVQSAEDCWQTVINDVRLHGIHGKTYLHLSRAKRKQLLDVLIQFNHLLRESLAT